MTLPATFNDLDQFTRSYIECAMWSSTTEPDGKSMDSHFGWADLSPELLRRIIDDCVSFQAKADLTEYPLANAGHDFWLTRNGHGAGFWENDYGTEAQCEKLTELSKSFGEFHIYLGNDCMIHGE